VGEKTAASLLRRFGDLHGIVAAAEDHGSDMAPGPRRKILDAEEYLAVAPKVVAVARDLDVGTPDLTLPLTPKDPDRLVELSERWGLGGSVARLVDALTR
jgi:5'-3' exonuclease